MDEIQSEEISNKVSFQLYVLPNSEDCNVAKDVIYSLGVPFEEFDATDLKIMRKLRELQNSEDVPFLYNTTTKKALSGRKEIVSFIREKYEEDAVSHLL